MSEFLPEAHGLKNVALGQRDPVTGEISIAGQLSFPTATSEPAPVAWVSFDPKNYISVMSSICTIFGLDHPQMMALRQRVEKTFHAQPQVFSKRAPAPATLNAVAITYGLLIGFGGYKEALKVSPDRVVRVSRGYDPFGDLDKELQKAMHKRAAANRRGRQ